MNYLLDKNIIFKNADRPRRGNKAGLVLWLIIILYFFGPWIYQGLSGVAVFFARPVLESSANNQGVLFRTLNFFRLQKSLVYDNDALKKQNASLLATVKADRFALGELQHLQTITGRYLPNPPPLVAEIFDRPPHLPFDTALIDIGKQQAPNLALGDRVVLQKNILLGEVVQIFNSTAKIKLYSSPGTILGVTIGPTSVPANATGVGGGNFTVTLPRGIHIEKGDMVAVQKPQSYLLGVVGSVNNDPRNPLQTVYISSPINLYELTWVEIVKR